MIDKYVLNGEKLKVSVLNLCSNSIKELRRNKIEDNKIKLLLDVIESISLIKQKFLNSQKVARQIKSALFQNLKGLDQIISENLSQLSAEKVIKEIIGKIKSYLLPPELLDKLPKPAKLFEPIIKEALLSNLLELTQNLPEPAELAEEIKSNASSKLESDLFNLTILLTLNDVKLQVELGRFIKSLYKIIMDKDTKDQEILSI